MTRRKRLTDDGVKALKPRAERYAYPDPEMPGHYIRVTPRGSKSYVAVAIGPDGKQVWATIESTALLGIQEAREKAREAINAIKAGEDRAGPQSFAAVAEVWLKRHVEKKKLRSEDAIRRSLDNHILPEWKGREFTSIRRGDVAKLLDKVEDGSGPVAADAVLHVIGNIANWYATRHEGYASPVIKGMRRSNPKERARKRILGDDELRAVWKQAEANGTFGAFVRLCLLTTQRLDKVAGMRWEDVSVDGTWTIPTEDREKGNAGKLPLPDIALSIIKAQPHFAGNPYVLAGRGKSHFSGFSKAKAAFDAKLPPMPRWTIHDLRRSARSLMSRAGVLSEHAERVLGHTIRGVEGVYNRYDFEAEKAHALRALAGLIETIINPHADNVVQYGAAR